VPVLTNETIFALRERPAHLLILGGGPIGVEMAQAHRRLGSAVTVVEGAQVLGRDDPEACGGGDRRTCNPKAWRMLEGQAVVRLRR
jgi:pyruvate/2-oxoglutarate dehydrogenase complex dihydrolipoamide dehydrogenase (E3) component